MTSQVCLEVNKQKKIRYVSSEEGTGGVRRPHSGKNGAIRFYKGVQPVRAFYFQRDENGGKKRILA